MDAPFYFGTIHKLHFHIFEAYGWSFLILGLSRSYIFAFLKLMEGPLFWSLMMLPFNFGTFFETTEAKGNPQKPKKPQINEALGKNTWIAPIPTKLNLNNRLYILSKANKLRGAAIKSSLTVPETTNWWTALGLAWSNNPSAVPLHRSDCFHTTLKKHLL